MPSQRTRPYNSLRHSYSTHWSTDRNSIQQHIFTRFSDQTLKLEATANGEVMLLQGSQTGCFNHGEALTLLEGKRRFKLIHEGRPVIPDEELGQMVSEALTLQLSLTTEQIGHSKETIIIIMATRQYLCFLSFHIPDAYVKKALHPGFYNNSEDGGPESEDEDEEGGFTTVRGTDWLDLSTKRCRQLAYDNVAAFVDWQLQSQSSSVLTRKLQSKTLDSRVVNGALIAASNPTFANWLASGPLTEYAKMLENHPLHDVWVGSAFIDRVDNPRFFYNFARGEVPADFIEGLITAATDTTQFVRCQDCIGAWEAGVYWFDDCYHDDPEHRACASCDFEVSECCDVTFSDNPPPL
ncbi:hypothetical protein B0T25DRAFT_565699 [Lasiosphaeria hispida]|uniref:Uncharacterized protein n=1 Tax=Lasiosphaeria hispida TaxID=260671 RepID=A0AAJ0HJZ9_9PEZI|nr:hypothetical protein B0T25DRAFT_565699 [Lasiosphaeria hispida]